MSIFFFKSLLSIVMAALAVFAVYTMFEIFGRSNPGVHTGRLKLAHKINGWIFCILFCIVSYFCLDFIVLSKAELSPRSTLHGALALSVLVIMALKIVFLHIYRQYYNLVKTAGLFIALFTFLMTGMSGGHYLLVSKFGTDNSFDKIMLYKKRINQSSITKTAEGVGFAITSDPDSIGRGKDLFVAKCSFCHDTRSTEEIVGPGLKGVLKNRTLPASGRSASPQNIIRQFKQPFNRMPSFEYLSEKEMSDLIGYLNTL